MSDDGSGVPEEDAPRLFERFFRSDRARTTRGSGLGLAIVKHVVETAGGHVEARGLHHPTMAGDVRDPPLAELVDDVQASDRLARVQHREGEVDRLGGQKRAAGYASHRFQRALRIAQVEEQAPTDHDVERAQLVGVEVVDRHLVSLDLRAEDVGRQGEPRPLVRSGDTGELAAGTRPEPGRPVPFVMVGDVDRHHLGGASALHLEGEIAVVHSDVQATLALDVGQRQPIDDRAEVEPTRSDEPGLEFGNADAYQRTENRSLPARPPPTVEIDDPNADHRLTERPTGQRSR